MVFKELIYAFKGCFIYKCNRIFGRRKRQHEKDDLKGFKESAEVYGKGIVHFPKDCKLYCGRGLARNQSGDKKVHVKIGGKAKK